MGVTGLWRLIDASGKPVPLETLEGKTLAIDISIWIHQVVQGYQDRRGNAVPNAHLLGLYHRICKLLYFKIKPVFVFDGGVPLLKKNTIAARKKQKAIAAGKAVQLKNDLLHNLMKHSLVKGVLAKKTGADDGESSTSDLSKTETAVSDMFKLPQLPADYVEEASDSEDLDSSVELSPRKQHKWKGNIHTVDVACDDFKALPADVRYDILTDLKETRKQNSWGRLHEIPEESNKFSSYQMERLLKRRKVQESLEAAEQEMGGKTLTLDELEKLMIEQGVDTKSRDTAYRIASDSTTRLVYINDPKSLKSSQEVQKDIESDQSQPGCSKDSQSAEESTSTPEDSSSLLFDINEYSFEDEWDSDIEFIEQAVSTPTKKKYFGKITSNPALAYMLENTELSQGQILELIQQSKANVRNANKIEEKKRRRSSSERHVGSKKMKTDIDFLDIADIKEEIISDDEQSSPIQASMNSDSESDDFVEVGNFALSPKVPPEGIVSGSSVQEIKNIPAVAIMSTDDSDSDDFVEVQNPPNRSTTAEGKIEITVNKNQGIDEEDIFADIFTSQPAVRNLLSDFSSASRDVRFENVEKKESEALVLNSSIEDTDSVKTLVEKSVLQTDITKQVLADERIIPSENFRDPKEKSKSSDDVIKVTTEGIKTPESVPRISVNNIQILESPELQSPVPEELPTQKTPEKIVEDHSQVSEKVTEVISRLQKDRQELISKTKNEDDLREMESQLETEHQSLKENIGKLERQATEVTEQMRSDAQDLLRLFGIPYVVAPQEAEAQCAYLECLNLTDGTITDDSDIWLFGGRCVYKNFFNNAKRVLQYQAKDIEHHFKLSRNQMIQLALLVGSDYTVGVPGVGPVTALEILASFPSQGDDLLRGLMNFSLWLSGGRVVGPGKASLRSKLKSVVVDRGFPSQAIVQAYLFPTVDESKEPFTWGKPNQVLLGDYTREKFGWTRAKFEETMGPVIKRMEEGKSQKDIMHYFKVKTVPKSIEETLSKRVQKAVQKLGKGEDANEDTDEQNENAEDVEPKKRRKAAAKKTEKNGDHVEGVSCEIGNDEKVELSDIVGKKIKKAAEVIPQREKDKQIALKKKLRAIEVFRKSKKGPGKSRKKNVRPARNVVKEQANLSESSSDED